MHRFRDLLEHFPFRHIDKTKVTAIGDLSERTDLNGAEGFAQVAGTLKSYEAVGYRGSKRLIALLEDSSGSLELTWFQGLNWVQKSLQIGQSYLVYGRISFFNGRPQIIHPD